MLEFLYQALASPAGIKLRTTDVKLLQQRLYKIRADAGDPELDQLALVPSPTSDEELWIVKRKPDAA